MTYGRITANLPSHDLDGTEAFYRRLGFDTVYRGDVWMNLDRAGMEVEFFPHPDLNPLDSWFSASVRLGDIYAVQAEWLALGLATDGSALPRVGAAPFEPGGDAQRMFVTVDPDWSLWRVLDDKDAT
jgi:hypothetical protein